MTEKAPPKSTLKQVRVLLWILVAVAIAGTAALLLIPRAQAPIESAGPVKATFGGPKGSSPAASKAPKILPARPADKEASRVDGDPTGRRS